MNISNTGYQISISFAKLLRKVVPLNYFVGRFGGDEFIVITENISGREEAEELIQKNTRHFAKRQLTWYRRMPYIHWVEKTPSDGDIWYREILAYVISQVRGESQDGR